MRKIAFVVALVVISAGCGAAEERSAGRPGSTSLPVESGPSIPLDEAEKTRAPLILLESEAGIQSAVPGSSCVDYVDEATGQGVGTCADTGPISAELLSTVRPGEEIRILVEDADVIRPEGCHSEDEQGCIGSAVVRPFGCETTVVARIPLVLGPQTAWKIDLPAGEYEVDVFAYFEAEDGRSGDVTGVLGLLVDETATPEIVPKPGAVAGCG